ncbi:hypothetical protein CPT34_08620 [Rhizobium sophoriradicis]|uniref:Uncharacterized protein n=1 Tax=Rhizobium sophoriradicis TaxID=1535245 RepID=A0A2A5KW70_9HYPH|nr:hypothetical protein CPT34_08620 [Rhizobium sophoriradicis]
MLGLEPSIHAASIGSSCMDPRLKAWDDGGCGWRFRQSRQSRETPHKDERVCPPLAPSCSALSRASTPHPSAAVAWIPGSRPGMTESVVGGVRQMRCQREKGG